MDSITVSPAYNRDYKNKKKAVDDWENGKDFFLESIDGQPVGKYCSNRDFDNSVEVNIRYNRKERKVILNY